MLFIRSTHISSRLRYALTLIFDHVLQLSYEVSEELPTEELPVLEYGEKHAANSLHIPACGLLAEESLRPWRAEQLQEDLFARVFWWVTEYEKVQNPQYDAHGRYDEKTYTGHVLAWHLEPKVHLWAEQLWGELQSRWPHLRRKERRYEGLVTFDLDFPWKYLNKGFGITVGSLAKKLLKADLYGLKEQLRAMLTRNDPYFTFDQIRRIVPSEQVLLFCLIDRHSTQDSRFTFENSKLQSLLRSLARAGYELGIHPSYTSMEVAGRIAFEKDKLAEIIQQPVRHSRQHFLRYRLPDTFQRLLDAGIQHDYSLGLYSEIGFRTGMAIPYPWFDLSTNQQTTLMLHPTHAMDRTLESYMKLGPQAATEHVIALVEQVRQLDATFVLLLHNDSLSESGEWRGWRSHIIRMIDAVLHHPNKA